MIPQAPITQQPQTNKVSEVQSTDQLERNDLDQAVKEVVLKQMILAALEQNQQAGVRSGVTVVDLQDHHEIVGQEQNTKHFAASVNKVPVALLLLEDLRTGKLSLNQTVAWQASDVRGGFGVYDQPGAPMQATLRDVIYDMLHDSGNTVVRASVNYLLGGPAKVNERFATKPQLSNTSLTVLTPTSFYLGDSTPHDALWALEQINAGNDTYAKRMKEAMATNIFTDFGVRSEIENTRGIRLTNKIGLLDDVEGNNRHDVGIIYNKKTAKSYGYAFFTTSPFDSPTATPQADQSLKDMGSYVLRFAGDQKRIKRSETLRRAAPNDRRIRY